MSDGRSLAGISIPSWMKSRTTDSIPAQDPDEQFLFIPYPRIERRPKSPKRTTTIEDRTLGNNYINHTEPCKQFLQNNCQVGKAPMREAGIKIKSSGTDDGFKGEAAQCGSSVIRVAHQMVTGKFKTENAMDVNDSMRPPGFDPNKRRGSKSLPTTPLGSPKGRRRGVNKYFTGAFVEGDGRSHWILQSLLGKRDISRSIGFIAEEGSKEGLYRTGSEMLDDDKNKSKTDLRAKPSELREMNFWSPTSM